MRDEYVRGVRREVSLIFTQTDKDTLNTSNCDIRCPLYGSNLGSEKSFHGWISLISNCFIVEETVFRMLENAKQKTDRMSPPLQNRFASNCMQEH